MTDLFGDAPKPIKLTAEEIEAAKTPKGGWTKAILAGWGVSWPPPKGWRRALIAGCAIADLPPEPETVPIERESHPDSVEAKLLHDVVMAVINAGQGDILKELDDVNAHYGCRIPTVADVIGGRPETAIVTGDIAFDDKVYSFRCARTVHRPSSSGSPRGRRVIAVGSDRKIWPYDSNARHFGDPPEDRVYPEDLPEDLAARDDRSRRD